MSEKADKGGGPLEPSKLTDNLAPTIHDLLRYGYAGVSGVVALIYLNHGLADLPTELEAIGAIGLAAIIPFGATVYIASRTVFAPPIVFTFEALYGLSVWIQTSLRAMADHLFAKPRLLWKALGCILVAFSSCLYCRSTSRARTRFMFFRREFGLSFFESELAFQVVRESGKRKIRGLFEAEGLWPNSVQSQFYRQHSELQMIYATSLVLLIAAWIGHAFITDAGPKVVHLLCVAVILATVGGIADIFVSRRECAEILDAETRQPGTIKALLESHGLNIRPKASL